MTRLRTMVAMVSVMAAALGICVETSTPPDRVRDTARATWLVIVDDLHLSFVDTGRLRTLVVSMVNELAQGGDLVTIQTTGPSSVATEPFGDLQKLSSAVKRITGNGLKPEDIVRGAFDAGFPRESLYRAQVSLSAAAEASARLKPDMTVLALLFISHGFPLNVAGLAELRSLTDGATRDATPIFAIDPQNHPRLQYPSTATVSAGWEDYRRAARESLTLLAESTGGFAVLDERDWDAPIERIKSLVRR